MITAKRLREVLNYDEDTGHFTWAREIRSEGRKSTKFGKRAGHKMHKGGYRQICVDGKVMLEHRAVWLYVHGEMPVNFIDHINGIRDDNRIANLRDFTFSQNCGHRTKKAKNSNQDMPVGVVDTNRPLAKRFTARIRRDGNDKFLGYFETPEEARAAYVLAKIMAE